LAQQGLMFDGIAPMRRWGAAAAATRQKRRRVATLRLDAARWAAYKVSKRKQNRARARRRFLERPDHYRAIKRTARALKRVLRFGLTAEQWKRACERRQCDACGIPFQARGKASRHTDHDHGSEKFRGMLCHNCNISLGMMGESPQALRALADYIESPPPWP
jgi:Recombination endonuclease VII